jgi:hypothetical protein
MADRIEANRLVKLRTRLHDDDTIVVILEDDKRKKFGCFLNRIQLNIFLEALLGIAGEWADKSDLAIKTSVRSKKGLSAKQISFDQGPNSGECAVHVSIGPKIELTFMLPLNDTIRGMAEFVRKINRSAR